VAPDCGELALPIYVWGQGCATLTLAPPTPAPTPCEDARVVVRLDARDSGYPNQDYSRVLVNGNFKTRPADGSWDYGYEMTDQGNGIYAAELQVPPGASHEFVFAVTGPADSYSGWGQSSKAALGGPCDWNPNDAWPNYGFTAPSACGATKTLPLYKWGAGCLAP